MHAVVCPDKFRGTLSAPEAAEAMAAGLRRGGFEEVREIPLADGGEGTLDALLAAVGGSLRVERVAGPLGDEVEACWAVLTGGVGVVEMARAGGLGLVEGRNDPLRASTQGTGELIRAALRAGIRRIVVGVGGSATTDGGLGAVEALGWSLQGAEVTVACDVTTRFLDAARVFGPQKGASGPQVNLLSRRLARLAHDYSARTGTDVTGIEGGGAAGGLAGGLAAIGARLEPGFDVVAGAAGLAEALDGAALAVTGEGKLDLTSLEGKVVGGVLEWAADAGVAQLAVVAGQVTDDVRDEISVRGPVQVVALADRADHSAEAFTRAAALVEDACVELAQTVLGSPR